MNKYKLSIIIPCYNSAEFLRETLDSVQAQTLKNWECIIVNDGSIDCSLEIAEEYAEKDKRFVVIDKPNSGPADTRNVGIRASHGKYILPLDSDDLIDPTYAEKAVNYLETHPEVSLVYCKASFFGDINEEWNLPEYNFDKFLFGNLIFCSCVFRREDYNKTDGYDANMKQGLEDWDFLLSLLNAESKVYRIPEVLFFYRQHGESVNSRANMQLQKLHNKIVVKHIDLYFPYLYRVISYPQEDINYLHKELDDILKSNAYKLGSFLLLPFRRLKEIISKNKSWLW